jgi:hypothetical protein
MHGIYSLQGEALDLHGTLKTDAELSKMSSGFKSVLLKPSTFSSRGSMRALSSPSTSSVPIRTRRPASIFR